MDEPKTEAEMFERKLGPGLRLGRKRNRRQCIQSLSGESEITNTDLPQQQQQQRPGQE